MKQSIDYTIRDNLRVYARKRTELRVAKSRYHLTSLALSRAVRHLTRKWDNER